MSRVDERLWQGDLRAAEYPILLNKVGVTHMVTLGMQIPQVAKDNIEFLWLKVPNERDTFDLDTCVEFIANALNSN